MSDHERPEVPSPEHLTPEEESLIALLDGADPASSSVSALRREDLEVCGLLCAATRRVQPRAEARGELIRRATATRPRALPFRAPERDAFRWAPLALAATVLLAVALGAWGGYLWSELRQTRQVVAGLTAELDRVSGSSLPTVSSGSRGGVELEQVRFENERLREQIGWVTGPHVEVCSLSGLSSAQPDARATIFLRPDEGKWVLAARNLAKCELGRRYRLWFMNEHGEFVGGQPLEHVNGEALVEMASGDLPEAIQAVLLTLEFPDQFGDQPAGERVLFGDETVTVY